MVASTTTDDAFEGERGDALDDVAFLARSANRVRILGRLAAAPSTRRALADDTGVSRTTLDRIVNEFEDREWVERRDDGTYAATPTGAGLVDAFEPTLDAAVALRRLGDAVAWLPRDEHPIGLEHFSDARVWQPESDDPVETGRYFADLVREVDSLTVLSEWVPPEVLARAINDEIVTGDLDGEFLATTRVFERIAEVPSRLERWEEMLSAGASSWLVDDVPCNLFVFDDTVLIKASGPGAREASYGVPIESTNPRVREWALDIVEGYRADATRVDPKILFE
jgi:predicted transcriptional regulator